MRKHLNPIGVLSVLASVVIACGGSSSAADEPSEEELRSRPVSAQEAEQLFDKVDNNCAGNDNGNFSRFDARAFDAAAEMAKIKDDDRDAMGVGCFGDHAYSNSKPSAIAMFDKHLTD